MANIRLTERSDGTIYLQCKCGEIGRRCNYQAEVSFAAPGVSLLRQARLEAFEHCWSAHKIPAYLVGCEISKETSSASTMTPVSQLVEEFKRQEPAALGPQLVPEKKTA